MMGSIARPARHALLALTVCVQAMPASAGMLDFLFGSSAEKASTTAPVRSGRRVWPIGEFTEVRLVAAEPGAAANAHPINLPPETLRALLAGVRVPTAGIGDEPLFGVSELADLLESLHDALAVAAPNEDVLLVSTSRRGGGLLTAPTAVTARLFVVGDRLNLIVHDNRLEFFGQYRGAGTLPTFVFGSRANPSLSSVRHPAAAARRGDWLEIPFAAANAAVALPMPAPVAPAAPGAVAAPMPAAPAAVAPAAPARARDPAFYEEQELRLKSLKRLRDNNLISEEEYQQKRREILQTL